MPLSIADKFGPYEIVAPTGKGGMGEVWKAHDSRLKRDVAIESPPRSSVNGSSARRRQFRRLIVEGAVKGTAAMARGARCGPARGLIISTMMVFEQARWEGRATGTR